MKFRPYIRLHFPCPLEYGGCGAGMGEHCLNKVRGTRLIDVHAARWDIFYGRRSVPGDPVPLNEIPDRRRVQESEMHGPVHCPGCSICTVTARDVKSTLSVGSGRKPMRYTVEEVASVVHEANSALQNIQGDPVPSLRWCCESPQIRESATDSVRMVCAAPPPDPQLLSAWRDYIWALAEELHAEWCAFKKASGWIYGPEKSADLKTHPCLVDFGELPAHQQDKDLLFASTVFVFRYLSVPVEAGVSP